MIQPPKTKTHCFNCDNDDMIRYTESRNGGWHQAVRHCTACGARSKILLTVGDDTGVNNKALKDLGIGEITYHLPNKSR